ncbi:hypothetical protein CVU75_01325 [Candidatus Dependentiae bacterium HGW-Dependentiae-1]|nr:MAG: hypothetical protein CVU75_01325 [Candidatus Dependentiae bacterium HGW-Dependentiae-1]
MKKLLLITLSLFLVNADSLLANITIKNLSPVPITLRATYSSTRVLNAPVPTCNEPGKTANTTGAFFKQRVEGEETVQIPRLNRECESLTSIDFIEKDNSTTDLIQDVTGKSSYKIDRDKYDNWFVVEE